MAAKMSAEKEPLKEMMIEPTSRKRMMNVIATCANC